MKKLIILFMLLGVEAFAQAPITIKLGTLSPTGSAWHVALRTVDEKWAEASKGQVRLRVYPGGTQGSEGEMFRKIAIGQLQGAAVSNVGLHDIIPEPAIFSTPGLFDESIYYKVMPALKATLESKLEAKGLVAIAWVYIGQVYVFCRDPYKTPEQARAGKFFVWGGDPGAVEAFERMGFRSIVLSPTDIIPSLRTGMISCVTQVPAYVLTARLFESARNMVNFPWSSLVAAVVIQKSTWDRIPAELRGRLLKIADEVTAGLNQSSHKLNQDAIETMKKQGLNVIDVDIAPWRATAEKSWPAIREKIVPTAMFDEVVRLTTAARQSNAK